MSVDGDARDPAIRPADDGSVSGNIRLTRISPVINLPCTVMMVLTVIQCLTTFSNISKDQLLVMCIDPKEPSVS
jgi:hypothetical protein